MISLMSVVRDAKARGLWVECKVDGFAASMAAVFLSACSYRSMTPGSAIMIHGASVESEGTAKDHRSVAKRLSEINRALAIMMAGRMCVSLDRVYVMLQSGEDTWLSADEALAACAIDEVTK